MISNSYTSGIIDITARNYGGEIIYVENFASFVEAVTPEIVDKEVILTFGDSNTTNMGSWPSKLRDITQGIVLNLGDWATESVSLSFIIDYSAKWMKKTAARSVDAVLLAGLVDAARLQDYYIRYRKGIARSMFPLNEEWLAQQEAGADLAKLHLRPAIGVADAWIARRIQASYLAFSNMCQLQGVRFLAVLQPLCYREMSPRYFEDLERTYAEEQSELSFGAWLQAKRFSETPEKILGDVKVKGILMKMIASPTFYTLDATNLFQDGTLNGFDTHNDAVHYSSEGKQLIAEVIANRIRLNQV